MRFEPQDTPRLFSVPCGVDFPRALVQGMIERASGQPPEALAKAELIVNTSRMARRVRDLFDRGPSVLLPKISLLTDLDLRATLRGLLGDGKNMHGVCYYTGVVWQPRTSAGHAA